MTQISCISMPFWLCSLGCGGLDLPGHRFGREKKYAWTETTFYKCCGRTRSPTGGRRPRNLRFRILMGATGIPSSLAASSPPHAPLRPGATFSQSVQLPPGLLVFGMPGRCHPRVRGAEKSLPRSWELHSQLLGSLLSAPRTPEWRRPGMPKTSNPGGS